MIGPRCTAPPCHLADVMSDMIMPSDMCTADRTPLAPAAAPPGAPPPAGMATPTLTGTRPTAAAAAAAAAAAVLLLTLLLLASLPSLVANVLDLTCTAVEGNREGSVTWDEVEKAGVAEKEAEEEREREGGAAARSTMEATERLRVEALGRNR